MTMCVTKIDKESALPGGEKIIRGTLKLSANYYTGGDGLNLANYFTNAIVPTVVVSATNGWCLEHDQGTAYAGKVIAKASTGNVVATPIMFQCAANTDMSTVNAMFFAIGQPY